MKTLINLKKGFLFILFALVLLSCQDDTINEIPQEEINAEESIKNEANARHGHYQRNAYVLVHGAWHPASCWADVKANLELLGHTVTVVQLPGMGNDPTPVETVTFQDHVNAVSHAVQQQSKPVVLVGHSYATGVISQVGENIPQHIKKLVYVSGFMPFNGETIGELAGADTASLVVKNLIVEGAVAFMTQDNYNSALYNVALKSPIPYIVRRAQSTISKLRPHPVVTLVTPLNLSTAFENLEKVYIVCLKDKAVTAAAQRQMYSRYPDTRVYTIPHTDHSPFITTPFTLTDILRKQ